MAEHQTGLHMNHGDGEMSYAKNSTIQMDVISKTLSIVNDTIENMFITQFSPFDTEESFRIADLGCASGPNTFHFVSEVIDIVYKLSNKYNNKPLETLIVLNDLHKNDFNSIFISLPSFYEKLKEKYGYEFSRKCFITAAPTSFYERILPCKSLHFVYSSYSLHWISQVPKHLDNKGHIYIEKTGNPSVFDAYKNQFEKDFSSFLTHRSYEIVPMGRMILTLVGRRISDPSDNDSWCLYELLAQSLMDGVSQGFVKEEDVDSFNLPLYHPYKDEVKAIIENQNSFHLEKLHVFNYEGNPEDKNYDIINRKISGRYLSNSIRSITEALLVSHFGELDLDHVFKRYEERVDVDQLHPEKSRFTNLMICLKKK